MPLVFQTNDRYAGPVLGERWQVLASAVGPTYYVYDHKKEDILRNEHKDIRRFASVEMAAAFIGFTSMGEVISEEDLAILARQHQETIMAKAAVKKAAPAISKAAPKNVSRVVKAAAPAPKVTEAPRKGRSISTSGTLSARTRELITAGKGNDEVMATLRKEFEKVPGNAASYHRAKMQ